MTVVELEAAGAAGTRRRLPRGRAALLVAGAASAAAVAALAGAGEHVNPAGWSRLEAFFGAALHPRLDAAFLELTAAAARTTLAYAAAGTALSLLLGFAGALAAARMTWRRRGPWLTVRAALALPRGVHEVVWGLALLTVLGLDPWVAVLAIALPFGAVTAKVFSELLDEAPQRPYRALRAAGAARLPALLYAAVPLAARDMLAYAFYRFECAIRSAAVLGLVGAGGLGFELALSFQSLRYDEMWTLLYALIGLSALADAWSGLVRRRAGAGAAPGRRRDPILAGSALAGAALAGAGAWWLWLDPAALVGGGVRERAGALLAGALPPALPDGGWPVLLEATAQTLVMSVVAGALAFGGGLALLPVAARLGDARAGGRGAALVARAGLLVLRAIPAPVWAFLVLFVLYPGPLAGAVALGIYNLGVGGRLLAEAAETLDPRPRQALQAAGASRLGALAYATLPGGLARFAAIGVYRWEVAVRETVVVGVVGAGGLGLLLRHELSAFDHAAALTAVLGIVALTFLADLAGARIRAALR